MKVEALNAALIDLAQYGRILVKHQWEAEAVRSAAPEETRAEEIGGMWAVEVIGNAVHERGDEL